MKFQVFSCIETIIDYKYQAQIMFTLFFDRTYYLKIPINIPTIITIYY